MERHKGHKGECVPKATCQAQFEKCTLGFDDLPWPTKVCCGGLKCKANPGQHYGRCVQKGNVYKYKRILYINITVRNNS